MMRRYFWATAIAAALAVGWVYRGAMVAEREASGEVSREGEYAFRYAVLDPASAAGWEEIAAPEDYRDAIIWRGALYIAGANALYRYTAAGDADGVWRAGRELPAAPLTALAASGDELWIATEGEGAVSFDGQQFRQLLPGAPAARKVTSLLPVASGALLLGTGGAGVLRFDGDRLRAAHPVLESVAATALAGVEESLWAGTRDAGVIHVRAGHAERFSESEGLPDRAVHAITVHGNRAYAGTSTGIAVFAGGRLERTLGTGLMARTLDASEQELLAGTLSDGFVRIPLDGGRAPQPEEILGEVRRVFREGGDIYVLRPSGLDVIRDGRTLRAVTATGARLRDGNISALARDGAGRLWVGYFDRGLDILDTQSDRITPVEDERIFCVNRIQATADGGQVAVATANGLVYFDATGRQRQVLTASDGLIASHVTDLVPWGRGWAAATPAGITFLDGGARSIYAFQGLVNNHVYALGAANGRLLAGTLGGVSVLEGEAVRTSYTTANSGLKTNWVTAFARFGEDWFAGTYGGGVQRLTRAGTWESMDGLPKGAVVNPNAMAATARAVYAGTLEHGILVWTPEAGTWRAMTAGLPSRNVTAILYDGSRLYLGTSNGLVAVPESGLVP